MLISIRGLVLLCTVFLTRSNARALIMDCSVTPNKRVIFVWESRTGQFGPGEMEMLESLPVDRLASNIMVSPPVVALRCLAEVMLHEDEARLAALMAIPEVAVSWLNFGDDSGLDLRDFDYARQLNERFGS